MCMAENSKKVWLIKKYLCKKYVEKWEKIIYNPIFDSLRAEKAKILRKIKGFGFLRLAYFFCLFRFSKIFFHLF